MGQSESADLKPESGRQRRDSAFLGKMQKMRDAPHSRPYAFSGGYILFKSKNTTITVNILACSIVGALGGAIVGSWANSIASALGGAIGCAWFIGGIFSRSKKAPIN